MLGHDPEPVALEAVAVRRAPALPGPAAGGLQDRPAAQQTLRDPGLDQRVEEVLGERGGQAALVDSHRPVTPGAVASPEKALRASELSTGRDILFAGPVSRCATWPPRWA